MISLENYLLSSDERVAIESLLARKGKNMSLQDLYRLMDEIWMSYGCDASHYDEKNMHNSTVILFGCSTVFSWSSMRNPVDIVLQ